MRMIQPRTRYILKVAAGRVHFMGKFRRDKRRVSVEYCINDIMAQVKLCLQSVIAGNKKMVMENDAFKVTVYQMGSMSNIRIDIKENE